MDLTTFDSALALLGKITGFVVISGFSAFALVQFYGKKWLEDRFERGIEYTKAEHSRELERLKADINAQYNRTRILHDREFEALPKVWELLNEAYRSAARFCSAGQRLPDITDLDHEDRLDAMRKSEFDEGEIRRVMKSSNVPEEFQKLVTWKRYIITQDNLVAFVRYYDFNKIFFAVSIRDKIDTIYALMRDAVSEKENELRFPDPRPGRWPARDQLKERGENLLDEIDKEVVATLWKS